MRGSHVLSWADDPESSGPFGSSPAPAMVDLRDVHFERLTIESGDATFTLHLDPRMTVIAGVGPAEREGLIAELVGGLSSGRNGRPPRDLLGRRRPLRGPPPGRRAPTG